MTDVARGNDPAQDPAVVLLRELPVEETIVVYVELAEDTPEKADVAALALREQGRLGRLTAEHVELLAGCIEMAPNSLCTGHLAKAVAALGRRATAAAETLIARMESMVVTDDVEYWSFDGCVWALGYLGGPEVGPYLSTLEHEDPSRVIRSRSIYAGAMSTEDRERRFVLAIEGARNLLASPDPGEWRRSFLTVERATAAAQAPGKSWDLRAGTRGARGKDRPPRK